MSELILYTSEDGQTRLHLRVEADTLWLSQLEIAELFQTSKQNVSLHAKNIFADDELRLEATVKESLTVQSEGDRLVKRTITCLNKAGVSPERKKPVLLTGRKSSCWNSWKNS